MSINPLYYNDFFSNPLEYNINTGITIGGEDLTIRPRTEKGWTLDFIINKDSLPWYSGSTFYYWGIKDETIESYYLDNNLSFSFTPEGNVMWESYRYDAYCLSGYTTGGTISNDYTEVGYISTGITPTLCSGGTSNDFNLTIIFERDRTFVNCDIENEGGLNDQITGYTVTNPYGVVTGDTEQYTLINQLGDKWLKEREMRMGTLKFYLNGRLLHKESNWEEIIPTVRGSLNPIIQVWGGGTNGSGEIHTGVSEFDIKKVTYYEVPLTYLQVKDNYLLAKSTYTITECYEPCTDKFPFFTYVVQPSLSYPGMEDWGFVEMMFLVNQYTDAEIGNGWIEPGGGLVPIYSMFPFPQPTVEPENGSLIYRYTYETLHPEIHVLYPTTSDRFRANFFSNGTKTAESVWSLDLYFLNIIDTLDVSMFKNINHLDINFANFTNLIFPTTSNSDLGFDLHMFYAFNIKTVDMSSLDISYLPHSEIQIWYCEQIETVKLPVEGHIHRLELSNLPNLTSISDGNLIFDDTLIIESCYNLMSIEGLGNSSPLTNLRIKGIGAPYFDVKDFPNLTNRSGEAPGVGEPCRYDLSNNSFTTTVVNRILVDFTIISTSGYLYRTIDLRGNFPPDDHSGGLDGIDAINSLQSMGFTVLTT